MTDLAAHLVNKLDGYHKPVRAACVASTPQELEQAIKALLDCCASGSVKRIDRGQQIFLSDSNTPPRIGFLFSGTSLACLYRWRNLVAAVQQCGRSLQTRPSVGDKER